MEKSKQSDTQWTDAERATLRRMVRYALAIFAAIAITLIVVGVAARLLGV